MSDSPKPVRVDRLALTFLVDNSIEWFGNLPPGFINESRLHGVNGDFALDERTGVPMMDLEKFCCGAHGFSVVIETTARGESSTVVFDSGPESQSIIRNIKALTLDNKIRNASDFVLSHWHADHSGGLLALLKYREGLKPTKPITVDVHPDRPIARGIRPPNGTTITARLPDDPSFDEIQAVGGTVARHDEPHLVGGGHVFVSGRIPRVSGFEKGIIGGVRWIEDEQGKGQWITDHEIWDERYAVVDVIGKGLVIFSACSHAGIVNVVRDAVARLSRPVYMVVGGLHLGGPELYPCIPPTVEFLSQTLKPAPTYILPMHCSGFKVKVALEHAFGEGCLAASTGMFCEIKGDAALDERLSISML